MNIYIVIHSDRKFAHGNERPFHWNARNGSASSKYVQIYYFYFELN